MELMKTDSRAELIQKIKNLERFIEEAMNSDGIERREREKRQLKETKERMTKMKIQLDRWALLVEDITGGDIRPKKSNKRPYSTCPEIEMRNPKIRRVFTKKWAQTKIIASASYIKGRREGKGKQNVEDLKAHKLIDLLIETVAKIDQKEVTKELMKRFWDLLPLMGLVNKKKK